MTYFKITHGSKNNLQEKLENSPKLGNTMYLNLCDVAKAGQKEKFINLNTYTQEVKVIWSQKMKSKLKPH